MSDSETSPTLNDDETMQEETSTRSRSYYFDDGDIIVRSSDNVDFKVHKYQLMAASPVFRLMFQDVSAAQTDSPMKLTDPHFEREAHLNQFFNLIYKGRLPIYWEDRIPDCVALGRLLSKYDCHRDSTTFYAHLYLACGGGGIYEGEVVNIFVIAAILDRPDICARAIRRDWSPPNHCVGSAKEDPLADFSGEGPVWDMTRLRFSVYSTIPPVYLQALVRAGWAVARNGRVNEMTRVEVSDKFTAYLKGIKPS